MTDNDLLYVVTNEGVKGPFTLAKLEEFTKRKGPNFDIQVSKSSDGKGATKLADYSKKQLQDIDNRSNNQDPYLREVRNICSSFAREAKETISGWNAQAQKRALTAEKKPLGDRHLKPLNIDVPVPTLDKIVKHNYKLQKVSINKKVI